MHDNIDSKQLAVFIFIAVMALKIFLAPGLLIKYSGRDGWISMLVFVLIELAVLLMLLIIIKLNPEKTLYEILKASLGVIVAKIVLVVLIALLAVKLILMLGELKLFFNTEILKSVDFTFCLIVLLFLLVVFCCKGIRPIGRMAQLFFPFILAALAILFLLTVKNVDLTGLTPIDFDVKEILGTLNKFPLWFGDVSVLMLFIGRVKQGKRFVLKGMAWAAASSVAVMFFAIVLFETYGDYPKIIDYGHNISNMVLYSSGSYLFGRFDIPIFCMWMWSIFIQIIVSFFAISLFTSEVVGRGNVRIYAVITAVIMFILSTFVFDGKTALFELGTSIARWLCLAAEIVLPVTLLVISLVRRGKDEVNSGQENSDN